MSHKLFKKRKRDITAKAKQAERHDAILGLNTPSKETKTQEAQNEESDCEFFESEEEPSPTSSTQKIETSPISSERKTEIMYDILSFFQTYFFSFSFV
jgi:hypothetical protein